MAANVTVSGKIKRNGRVYTVSASGADSQAVEGLIAELETSTGRTTPPAGEHLARVERVELEPGAVRIAFAIVDASANAIRNWRIFDRVKRGGWVHRALQNLWRKYEPQVKNWEELEGAIFRVKVGSGGLVREYVRFEGRAKPLLERAI